MIRRRNNGFTLVECLLALSITAITALAVAGVSTALSNASRHGTDLTRASQTARGVMRRVQSRLRSSALIVAAGEDRLLLWVGDANEDGQINASEVCVVHRDAETSQLSEYVVEFPDDMSDATRAAMDVTVTLNGLITAAAYAHESIEAFAYGQRRVLATDVTAFEPDSPVGPPLTRMVHIRLTVGEGTEQVELRSAGALRAPMVDHVEADGGGYTLNVPLPDDLAAGGPIGGGNGHGNGGGNGNGNGGGNGNGNGGGNRHGRR